MPHALHNFCFFVQKIAFILSNICVIDLIFIPLHRENNGFQIIINKTFINYVRNCIKS